MINEKRAQISEPVSFGPFTLLTAERLLEQEGTPVQLGARAFDILIALTERPGEVVSKRELMARVWPDVTVDEGNLRFHIAALRKALGDGQSGARYVTTVPGRGYCFVAPLSSSDMAASPPPEHPSPAQDHRLPPPLKRMVGREDVLTAVVERLKAERFVTIAGPGGIGKTTVAVTIAHTVLRRFGGAVHFFDLGPLSDGRLIPNAIASALGLIVQSHDPIAGLVTFLRDKHMLLVLDSCEHVIETAAALAERICEEAPNIFILATSREDLRVEGEHVHRLAPLDSPPDRDGLTAAQALAFPAAQLFVERVVASGHPFDLSDATAPIVGEICRKLDGVPLALELAAGNVGIYGIEETAELLDNRFKLLLHGRRTAVSRHQTLSATLDWSYDLLSETERVVLRRLSVFVGSFSLEACREVACCGIDAAEVVAAVASLVKKSLVAADIGETRTRYRLLDTTRSYALDKLIDSGEADETARRHALYYRTFLERIDADRSQNAGAGGYATYAEHLGNVRSALDWSFLKSGDSRLTIALAVTAARLLLGMSLLTECYRWVERAVAALDDRTRGSHEEMKLQAALGLAGMFTKGNSEDVRAAFMRSLELSQALDEPVNELRVLGRLHLFHERIADYHSALSFGRQGKAVAVRIGDPAGMSASHSLLGIAHHLIGNQFLARRHLETALGLPSVSTRINKNFFGFDHHNRARIALARTLWLQGYPDQAENTARTTVEEAETLDHPVSLCIALIWAVSVALWSGDLDSAEDYIEQFIAHADRHSLAPYNAVGLGVRGELLVKRGKAEAGIRLLRNAQAILHKARYELLTTAFNGTLAEALTMAGQFQQALALTDQTIAQVERGGDLFTMPELLRIKGDILASSPQPDLAQAETCLRCSLELAREQCALGWELRTATRLALLRSQQNRPRDAHDILAPVYDRFTEGFESADLKAAWKLLNELRSSASG